MRSLHLWRRRYGPGTGTLIRAKRNARGSLPDGQQPTGMIRPMPPTTLRAADCRSMA